MKELSKTALILFFGFIGSFAILNSNFLYSQIQDLFAQTNKISHDVPEATTRTHLFPIALAEKAEPINPPAPPQTVTSSNVTVINSKTNIEIPVLGIKAPVIFEPTTNEDRIYKSLEKGVVHYSTTPQLGEPGTAIIIGHSSAYPWYRGKYGSIFAQLAKLKSGDIINVEKDGKILTYKVSRSLTFIPSSANDFELRELEATSGSSLVLMTCWPTGTNSKRVAVRADLII